MASDTENVDVEELKKMRRAAQMSFTKCANRLETVVNGEHSLEGSLLDEWRNLGKEYAKLSDITTEYIDALEEDDVGGDVGDRDQQDADKIF